MPIADNASFQRAEGLKAAGNTLYTGREFQKASKLYQEAFDCCPQPVYLSNLSAAQYELGKYKETVSVIKRALGLLQPPTDAALRSKLLLRSAKSNVYLGQYESALDDLAPLLDPAGPSADARASAFALKTVVEQERSLAEDFAADEITWKKRIIELPRYRNAPRPHMEYYTTGHDEACSIMEAQEVDQRDKVPEAQQMRMRIPSDSRSFEFSALFGGIGDARNFYATLHDLANQLSARRKSSNGQPKFHFTLVDIHPTALARDVIVIFSLMELARMDEDRAFTSPRARRVLSMLHYLYWATIMPPSLYDTLIDTIRTLHDGFSAAAANDKPISRSWVYVEKDTVKKVAESFRWWLEEGQTARTVAEMIPTRIEAEDEQTMLERSGNNPLFKAGLEELTRKRREQNLALFDDPTAIAMFKKRAADAGMPYEELVAMLKDSMMKDDEMSAELDMADSTPPGSLHERLLFSKIKILWPAEDVEEPAQFKKALRTLDLSYKASRDDKAASAAVARVRQRVNDAWRINVTYLDQNWLNAEKQHNPFSELDGIFRSSHLKAFMPKSASRLADYSDAFFSHAARGLRQLLQLGETALTIEVIAGDVWKVGEAITFETLDRPTTFPVLFDRLHFSNVPDYTGGHATMFSIGRPLLKSHRQAFLTSNVLLNSGLWGEGMHGDPCKAVDALMYHYAATTRADSSNAFGVQLVSEPTYLGFYSTFVATLPGSDMPLSRSKLQDILYGIFVRCVLPPPYENAQVQMTPRDVINVHTLFRVLRLFSRFHPRHHLAEIVESILENKVVANVQIHSFSPIPVPASNSTSRAIVPLCCVPFQAEFEVAAAVWRPFLGFPLFSRVPSLDDIGVYSISFGGLPQYIEESIPWNHMTMMLVLGERKELECAAAIKNLRAQVAGRANLSTSLNLVSTFHWQHENRIAHIPLTYHRVQEFQQRNYHCAIVNTIFWAVTSTLEPCHRLRRTGDLDHQTPSVKMVGSPVGKLAPGIDRLLISAMMGPQGGSMGGLMDMMGGMRVGRGGF